MSLFVVMLVQVPNAHHASLRDMHRSLVGICPAACIGFELVEPEPRFAGPRFGRIEGGGDQRYTGQFLTAELRFQSDLDSSRGLVDGLAVMAAVLEPGNGASDPWVESGGVQLRCWLHPPKVWSLRITRGGSLRCVRSMPLVHPGTRLISDRDVA